MEQYMRQDDYDILRELNETDKGSDISFSLVRLKENEKIVIRRYSSRGKVSNWVDKYEFINKDDISELLPLTEHIGHAIFSKLEDGESYASAFIFYEQKPPVTEDIPEKSEFEHKFTSTGIKFWRHQESLESYKNDDVPMNSVISTHISPEGACNLKCPYCSVTYRDTHSRIKLDVIKDYVVKLKSRGLKAVILTGGGEPTVYPHFNELVQWIKNDQNLSVALITNGTLTDRVEDETWKCFSWVRVSINLFDGWEAKIRLPYHKLSDDCIVGCSMVYTVEHEMTDDMLTDRVKLLQKVSKVADNCGAKYIRLLPNCLLEQYHLIRQHNALDNLLKDIADPRYFHQYKVHGVPQSCKCHQSFFRPYLSEEKHHETGEPGTVYPCDSVVLNDAYQHFGKQYQLCEAKDVLDYLDGKLKQQFDATKDCTGCVFTQNVNMLDEYKKGTIDRVSEFNKPLTHEEFV
jgi:organic radical activating enzyme